MQEGIIIRAYSGFYYVKSGETIWECKLRGRFRRAKERILVGDRVQVQETEPGKGVIEKLLPRQRELLRPAVANVQQVIIVMSLACPEPNLGLLDRLLVLAELEALEAVVVFNKVDLVSQESQDELFNLYQNVGYPVVLTSAATGKGIEELKEYLKDQISVLAGPSGVGKSSLLNAVQPGLSLRTGKVSRKQGRGRHTTRHVELLPLEFGGLVADSPGFSVLSLPNIQKEELSGCFRELREYVGRCRFNTCLHYKEPDCQVKEEVKKGTINQRRYESYIVLLLEVSERRY